MVNLFNHPTNVKTDSRVVCIVLKNMGENLRKSAMHKMGIRDRGYRAAVYCRLSKDDDLQGESASIANRCV